MRELHGYTLIKTNELSRLKKEVLFFDRIHVSRGDATSLEAEANYDFLVQNGVIVDFEREENPYQNTRDCGEFGGFDELREAAEIEYPWWHGATTDQTMQDRFMCVSEYLLRVHLGRGTDQASEFDKVPIRSMKTPKPPDHTRGAEPRPPLERVLNITINMLPVPSEETPWEAILDFRNELYSKRWTMRRWLRSLAANITANESELRDEIEFRLNEYTEAMELHKIKSRQSSLDVFLISPLEAIENIAKFNWSKIARGAFSVQKRKVDLMETEMKAAGREVAYIYDAQQRFSR